ncbi:hypothetical protein HPP92_012921 [Vanilla planifolia]|uniref:ubiquitinyl hydrolase 1 n=1 Tax=Vanilla planifolia TaxID=51239 RepID=A0A835R0Z3_VANPL|nr:hypothetical protein HPP92_012921 [Vanilla planifolia]
MLMIMYDHDPDVVRWGLHLLHVDSPSVVYGEKTTQYNANNCQLEYSHESNVSIDFVNVENDEVIAHALQEEYSQVALAEASGTSPAGQKHLQASVLAQDWLCPPVSSLAQENVGDNEPVNEVERNNTCSCSGENICEGEIWSLELADDFSSLDGEVCKRLNNMVPTPHIPRTNGEIPSVDEATSDYERLLERLELYDLVELKVHGDGNCQFRALSDQFYRTPEHHKFVREEIVNQLRSYPEIYEGYVPMAYGDYLKKISKLGEWGDHLTMQAAADWYGVKIFILTSFKDTCYIEIIPANQKSKRVIFLSFWAEVHYNSIYPKGELPSHETTVKKRWWHFGNKQ